MKTFIVLLTILYIVNAKRYKYKETHLNPRNWDYRTLSYDSYNNYKHKRENRNRKETEMHQLINLLKEISSDIKKPCRSPPPQVIYVPYPVLVPVPYYYQPGGETIGEIPAMSEETPNKHNTNIEDTHPEVEDNDAVHWSIASEDTDLDDDDDGKRPISFNTIESQEPLTRIPPVEHGSTQAGLDSVNNEETLEIDDDNKFNWPFQSEQPKSEVPPVKNYSTQAWLNGNIKDKVKINDFKNNQEDIYEKTGLDDLIRPVYFKTIQSKESISEVPSVEQGNLIKLNSVNIENRTETDDDSLIRLVSDEIPNIRNTNIGTTKCGFGENDNINWGISPEETDLNNDDGKRPISFNSIETPEPIIFHPVEHGSTQAGFNSVNVEDRLEIEDDNKFNWPFQSEEPNSEVPPVDYSSPQAGLNGVNINIHILEDTTKIDNDNLVRHVSEEILNIRNTNSSNNESEFEEDDNWGVPTEETELDNGDGKRPVSFEPIQSEEPISEVPDVEDASTQAELNSDNKDSIEMDDLHAQHVRSQEKTTTTTETPGGKKAVLAILTCCREDAAKRQRCFDLFGYTRKYNTGLACHSRVTDMAYKKLVEMQPKTI